MSISDLVYNPTDPAVRRDPFPVYRRLRDTDPVHWSPVLKSWIVTRYQDIKSVALDPEVSADRLADFYKALPSPTQKVLAEVVRYLSLWVSFRDPPEHRRLRRLMSGAINPKMVQNLRPAVETIVDDLATRLKPGEDIDIISDFAMPLPATVIMDMLGVPREHMHEIKHWSDELALFIGSARGVPDKYERARDGMRQIASLFRTLLAQRRADPRDDLLSGLIAARDEDESLSEDELVAACILVLFGGHETTTNLIGNAVLMLLEHPGERERLAADPGLIDSAVEEFLRYDGPSNSLCRMVAVDHEIAGKPMRRGDRIFAMLNAGNRDERAFSEPDRLDLGRDPNRHLTFGQGAHFCIGAPLARLEGALAVNALLARFPNMTLAGAEPEWRDAMIMRGMHSLRVRL